MRGLEGLPLPARDEVVRLLRPADALCSLPFVSKGTLVALQELCMPLGKVNARTVDEALQQAHALRRAWDLGTLRLDSYVRDVSGLAGCAALHTLNLSRTRVSDVSGLGRCAELRTLSLYMCRELTDASALGRCAALHTLDLSYCSQVTDVSALGRCAALHTLNLSVCRGLRDVSATGGLRGAAYARFLIQ